MTQADADATMARLSRSTRLEDLTDQRLIIEAVSERADIKASVFRTLDAVAHPDAILGSNTSSISITTLMVVAAATGLVSMLQAALAAGMRVYGFAPVAAGHLAALDVPTFARMSELPALIEAAVGG